MKYKDQHTIVLDGIDKIILNNLSDNARQSIAQIAKIVGVSPTAIHQRIRKLEESGLITGSRMEFNPNVVGYSTIAFIGIYLDKSSSYANVISSIKDISEVIEAHYTTGNYAIFAKVLCKDNNHLMNVLNGSIQSIKGIIRTETIISLDQKINRQLKF
ncbi:regulatory protein [Flavobacteriaceae bacterium UJ101]|nr:regulatory protein [Flavobacteriaceae bacterium UJ101]